MKDTQKHAFVRGFDSVSPFEGGVIYNKMLLCIRQGLDSGQAWVVVIAYAADRNQKTAEILEENHDLYLDAFQYGQWYESLPPEKRKPIKMLNKYRHFREHETAQDRTK